MNGLIEHIESNDPDYVTLTLTMECETVDELESLIQALEKNTTLKQVAFRESFFPLRNIRRHLPWSAFLQMLEAVGTKAVEYLFLPPTMMGMVRGQTAAHLFYANTNSCLQEFRANEALTFGTLEDVEDLAECLGECRNLRSVELGDSFFNRSSRRISEHMMDVLLIALAELPELQQVELSSHYEQQLSARTPSLLSSQALLYFLQQQQQQSSSLQLLNLSRMGLDDDHFEAIATFFSTPPPSPPTLFILGDATAPADVEVTADHTNNPHQHHSPDTIESVASSSQSQSIYTSPSASPSNDEDHTQQLVSLLRLCLDGNRPTKSGLMTLFRSLQHNPSVQSISLRDTVSATAAISSISPKDWSDTIFSSNFRLIDMDIDEHDNARLLGGSTNNSDNVTEFWTHLNSLGKRQHWQEDAAELRSGLWPLVLADVSQIDGDPSFVWYVVRNFAQYII